jgi:hypothetical protein
MFKSDQALHGSADRVPGPSGPEPQPAEATLLPMVRCVLRTGRGAAPLVRLVRRVLPAVTGPLQPGQAVDLDQTAGPVTRLVCKVMQQEMRFCPDGPSAALETVLGL